MMITQFTKKISTIDGPSEVRFELHRRQTFCSIKVWRQGKDLPEVRVGQPKYIAKVWKELTGKVAPL